MTWTGWSTVAFDVIPLLRRGGLPFLHVEEVAELPSLPRPVRLVTPQEPNHPKPLKPGLLVRLTNDGVNRMLPRFNCASRHLQTRLQRRNLIGGVKEHNKPLTADDVGNHLVLWELVGHVPNHAAHASASPGQCQLRDLSSRAVPAPGNRHGLACLGSRRLDRPNGRPAD